MTETSTQVVDMLKAAGFQVYMRKLTDEYCYCTDGTGIAYVQWSSWSRNGVSTVHVPNKQTGTGFQFAEEITINNVRQAMSCFAPHWALERDRQSVHKYKDWNDFHKASDWNAGLFQV